MASIIRISAVPGLYFAPTSELQHEDTQLNGRISHILRIEHSQVKTKPSPSDTNTSRPTTRTIRIQTPQVPDVLSHLDDISSWASQVLGSAAPKNTVNDNEHPPRLLISPSSPDTLLETSAILLALTMFYHHSPFSAAVRLTAQSLPDIHLHISALLERQLRIWHFCAFSATIPPPRPIPALPSTTHRLDSLDSSATMPGTWPLTPASTAPSSPVPQPVGLSIGERVGTPAKGKGHPEPEPKPAYEAWMKERDALVAAARMEDMGKVVARLARTRLEQQQQQHQGEAEGTSLSRRKSEQWQHVEDMERNWNEKLIRGMVAS